MLLRPACPIPHNVIERPPPEARTRSLRVDDAELHRHRVELQEIRRDGQRGGQLSRHLQRGEGKVVVERRKIESGAAADAYLRNNCHGSSIETISW